MPQSKQVGDMIIRSPSGENVALKFVTTYVESGFTLEDIQNFVQKTHDIVINENITYDMINKDDFRAWCKNQLKQVGTMVMKSSLKESPYYIIPDDDELDEDGLFPEEREMWDEFAETLVNPMKQYIEACQKKGIDPFKEV